MEEDDQITYSPKRIPPSIKKKEKKSVAKRLFPETEKSNLFRISDDDEEEDESGKEEEESRGEAVKVLTTASAKQTSRLEGSNIVYDETWEKFKSRTGTQILDQDFHPLEVPELDENSAQLLNEAKNADQRSYDRKTKLHNDRMRRFIDKIIGRAQMRPEDVYNGVISERPRTKFEQPEIVGLESISPQISSAIEMAFTQLKGQCRNQTPDTVEDIIFSDDAALVDLFAELAYLIMQTYGYLNGLRQRLESTIQQLHQRQFFVIRRIDKLFGMQSLSEPSLPTYFPRTSTGRKRPRYSLS